MTTIAIRDGVIAADTWIGNGIGLGRVSKIFIVKDKYVIAGAGTWSSIIKFVRWVERGRKALNYVGLQEDNRVLLVEYTDIPKRKYAIKHYDSCTDYLGYEIEADFFAIGSGYELAIGAMAHGASAVNAVHIASQYDTTTEEPIQHVNLKSKTLVIKTT
jgi:20S proteasome alpha/beta subunit